MILQSNTDPKTKLAFYLGLVLGTLERVLESEEEVKKFTDSKVPKNDLLNLRSQIIRVSDAFFDRPNNV